MLTFSIEGTPSIIYAGTSLYIDIGITYQKQAVQASMLKWRLVDLASGLLLVDWTTLEPTYPTATVSASALRMISRNYTELKRMTASATWRNPDTGTLETDNAIYDFAIHQLF